MVAGLRRRLAGHLAPGSFGRSVGILLGGTVAGRALPILSLPILTRLYSPADFSILAVYTGILTIVAAISCLRFELAIPLPDDDGLAANLLGLALASLGLVTALSVVAVWAFPAAIVSILGAKDLLPHLWLLPVGIACAGCYGATQYWATRHKRFRAVAVTRVSQSAVGTGVSLGLGFAGWAPLGLLLGNMLTTGVGFLGLGWTAVRRDLAALRKVRVETMRRALWTYRRFPTFSTMDALANNAGSQIPIIIIAALAAGPEAGFLMLATQVMRLPIALLGTSIAQVYLSRAAQEDREGTLAPFTSNVVRGLISMGVGPLIFIGLVSPAAFGLAFGQEWQRAGELVAWMTPWFMLQFISSPISMVMHVRGRQALLLAVTAFGGLLRIAGVLIAARVLGGYVSESFAVLSAMFYSVVCLACFRVAGVKLRDLLRGWQGMLSVTGGTMLGLAALWVLR